MKYLFIFIFIKIIFFSNITLSKSVFETKFHKIAIKNEIINEAKNREINKLKIKIIDKIFKKILIIKEKKRLIRKINLENQINYLIKNIIIENEFISQNIYKANIKINFDHNEIIELLRANKINYSDNESPNFLFIAFEENNLSVNGLSNNNSFYNYEFNTTDNLIQFIIPELSPNDRFILPYNKILNKNLLALKKISQKYNTNFIFLFLMKHKDKVVELEINLFSQNKNSLSFLKKLIVPLNKDFHNKLFLFLDDWWKMKNMIDNSIINHLNCEIYNSNIEELYLINSKINLVSQVRSNIIKKIQFKQNYQAISFYGSFDILLFSFLLNDIDIKINDSNECIIKLL